MNSLERLNRALNHSEPDRIPFDLAGTTVTGINKRAFIKAMEYRGLSTEYEKKEIDPIQQIVTPVEETLKILQTDVRRVGARRIPGFENSVRKTGTVNKITDAWNCLWKMDDSKDLYYNQYFFPLEGYSSLAEGLNNYRAPDISMEKEIIVQDLSEQIQTVSDYGVIADRNCAGLTEIFLRKTVIPRFAGLWAHIKKRLPGIKIFMHTCGSVRILLPDLIEAGLDIYNPVQFTAAGMNLKELKRDFGKDLVFWGGGVNTQSTLRTGSPQQVEDEVKRILDIMAPGGGFVFAAIHNIQEDVPPENFWAMWDTLMKYGKY